MITVAIYLNGVVVFARSAVNKGEALAGTGLHTYEVDDGTDLLHSKQDGLVELAKKVIGTVKEGGVNPK